MKQQPQIEHKGVVLASERGAVRVAIEVGEACASCSSRKACAIGASEQREIVVATDEAENYKVGEIVMVGAHRTTGIMAVVLCYVVPLVVLAAGLVFSSLLGLAEGVAALVALVVAGLYFGVLGLLRSRISQRVTFTIHKF